MEVRELKAAALVLAGFFVLGAVAGGCYALVSAHSVKTNKYNTAHLTQHLQYAEVEAGRLQCVVLLDKAELYNLPSGLEGKVIEAVKGGVVVLSNSVKVFIPASQTGVQRDGDLSVLVGSNVKFKIIDIKPGKKAVGSIKTVLSEERKARVEDFWNNIEVGKVYDGVVKSLTSYGAFVDLGGVDGLILLSELTWKRVPSPADVVSVGDHISVYVKSFDAEKKKIVLGHKTEETNPWYIFTTNYAVGDVVKAKIVNIVPFGAFAEIIDGVDGLIHISEISNKRIAKVDDVLTVGDVVDVEIIDIDSEKKKVSLSMKALISGEDAAEEAAPVEEAPADAE